jgi:hypothetical protein
MLQTLWKLGQIYPKAKNLLDWEPQVSLDEGSKNLFNGIWITDIGLRRFTV